MSKKSYNSRRTIAPNIAKRCFNNTLRFINVAAVNWKNSIVESEETGTVFLNKFHSPALRALRTERTSRLEKNVEENIMPEFGNAKDLYFGGDMEAAIPLSGQVAGRIEEIKSVVDILSETKEEFFATLRSLESQYL